MTIRESGNCTVTRPRTGGWGAEVAHDSGAVGASGQEAVSSATVSLRQMLEPAQTVLSSSAITGEGKSDFTRLAYQTLDALQYVSLVDREKGRLPVHVR